MLLHILDVVFPKNTNLRRAENLIPNLVKIKEHIGDNIINYPSPAYSFFNYRNPIIKKMIWRLKYKGDIKIAETFAVSMYDQLCEELADLKAWHNFLSPVLIPIPISKNRLRTRGYNQSMAICKALNQLDTNIFFEYCPDVLYKVKDTTSQARVKDRKSRLINLKDSFAIKDTTLLANKNIILLDDVLTTGSTLIEATETLKKAGVAQIIWLVVAH